MSQDAAVEGDKIRTLRVRERQPGQRDRKVPALGFVRSTVR